MAAGARTAGCWVGGAPANHRLCALSKTPLMMLPLMPLLLTPCLTPRTLPMLRPRPILLPLSTLPPRHPNPRHPNPRHPLTPLTLVVTVTVTIHRTLTMLRRVWMPLLVMMLPRNCLLQPAPELALGLAHVPRPLCLRKASGSKAASVVALSSALQLQQRFVPPLLRLRGGWRRFRRYCVLTTSCMAGPPQDGGLQFKLNLLVSSWNVGNAPPEDDLSPWVPKNGGDFDIIAVGVQESRYSVKGDSGAAMSTPRDSGKQEESDSKRSGTDDNSYVRAEALEG